MEEPVKPLSLSSHDAQTALPGARGSCRFRKGMFPSLATTESIDGFTELRPIMLRPASSVSNGSENEGGHPSQVSRRAKSSPARKSICLVAVFVTGSIGRMDAGLPGLSPSCQAKHIEQTFPQSEVMAQTVKYMVVSAAEDARHGELRHRGPFD